MATNQEIINMLLDIKENGGCIHCTDIGNREELIRGIIYLNPLNVKGWEKGLRIEYYRENYIYFTCRSFYQSNRAVGSIRYEYPMCFLNISPQTENEFMEMLK